MRQFGFVQGIPKEPMVQSKDRKGLMDYHWKSWLLDHVEEASRVKVSYQWQCTDTYMEWYASVAHLNVINPSKRKNNEARSYKRFVSILVWIKCFNLVGGNEWYNSLHLLY